MKTIPTLAIIVAAMAAGLTDRCATAQLVSQAFTYQGQLTSAGAPVTGTYDMTFLLFDAATGGSHQAVTCVDNVAVTNGLFTVSVDFSFATPFNGGARWLEIQVRPDSTVGNCNQGTFTALSPRQPLTAAPYASGLALPLYENVSYNGTAVTLVNPFGANGGTIVELAGPNAVYGTSHRPHAAAGSFWHYDGAADSYAVEAVASGGSAVFGTTNSSSGTAAGVAGHVGALTGAANGVYGDVESPDGKGVYGQNANSDAHGYLGGYLAGDTTAGIGVLGTSSTSNGYAGYFTGRGYFSDFVGLGIQNPSVPLQVIGGTDLSLSGGGNIVVGQISGANLVMDNNEIQARSSGAAAALFINANGGNVGINTNNAQGFQLAVNGTAAKPNGGSWSTLSDERVKRNIQPLAGALDKLLRLRGVTFEYVDPSVINELPGVHTGMVAQEVEKIAPEWVTTGPTGLKSIAFSGFEALTVEALRDLRDRTGAAEQADRSRIGALEQENRDLRRELEDLRSAVRALATQRGSAAQPLSSAR